MAPKPQEVRSQATPLSEDILKILQGQLDSGGPGGFGALGREAGTAARQFVNQGPAGQGLFDFDPSIGTQGFNFAPGTGAEAFDFDPTRGTGAFDFNRPDLSGTSGTAGFESSPLLAQLEAIQNRRTEEQAGNLREGFGAAGIRFGSSLVAGEGRLRRDLETNFSAGIGELLRQSFESQQGRQLQSRLTGQQQGIQLEGILGQLFEGQQQRQLASQGQAGALFSDQQRRALESAGLGGQFFENQQRRAGDAERARGGFFESERGRALQGAGQQLQGIDLMSVINQRNLAPFLQFGAQGINQNVFTENPFVSGINAAGNLAQGIGSIIPG